MKKCTCATGLAVGIGYLSGPIAWPSAQADTVNGAIFWVHMAVPMPMVVIVPTARFILCRGPNLC
jgi:hypothetical protein